MTHAQLHPRGASISTIMIHSMDQRHVWLHMPKTAGDTTRHIVESLSDQHHVVWNESHCHMNITEAIAAGVLDRSPVSVSINTRDLLDWMRSWTRFYMTKEDMCSTHVIDMLQQGRVCTTNNYWRATLGLSCQLVHGQNIYSFPPEQLLDHYLQDALKHTRDVRLLDIQHLGTSLSAEFQLDHEQVQHMCSNVMINQTRPGWGRDWMVGHEAAVRHVNSTWDQVQLMRDQPDQRLALYLLYQ